MSQFILLCLSGMCVMYCVYQIGYQNGRRKQAIEDWESFKKYREENCGG